MNSKQIKALLALKKKGHADEIEVAHCAWCLSTRLQIVHQVQSVVPIPFHTLADLDAAPVDWDDQAIWYCSGCDPEHGRMKRIGQGEISGGFGVMNFHPFMEAEII